MFRQIQTLLVLLLLAVATGSTQIREIVIRCDDIGMCHTVNMAFEKVAQAGIPVSASVMFACPWYTEAVEILKRYPHVAVGVHLAVNAEWKNYRWGPVAGWKAVPSLVDSLGYFLPTTAAFLERKPLTRDVEMEIRAQLERAIQSGLKITYVDTHMRSLSSAPELVNLVRSIAKEYGLGVSRCFGEKDLGGYYDTTPEAKLDTVLANLQSMTPGQPRLMVFHVGMQTPEMDALVDMNAIGPPQMSKHREAELRALLSEDFRRALDTLQIHPITYRQLIDRVGLQNSKCPDGKP
jgi:predicted glycoside hydrolase/deacetylase ChbG (UPF0249 family)